MRRVVRFQVFSAGLLGLALANFASAPAIAATSLTILPAGAVQCASENGTCSLPTGATATVYYGAGSSYTYQPGSSSSVGCNNASFGDPAPGVVKACYAIVTQTPVGGTQCAVENGTCALPAGTTTTIYYGAGSSYTYRLGASGSVPCSNTQFGDPVYGIAKACFVSTIQGPQAVPTWPTNPNWQAYSLVPQGPSSCPVAIQSTSGNVTNASSVLCNAGGGLTLTMAAGGPTPRVVLDYGKNVGGIPWLDVSAASGSPQVKVGYSETLLYLSDNGGDYPPVQFFGNGEGDVNRADVYTVAQPGLITNAYTQGGERFQVITLTSPGSVTLRGAGINYIADRTQAANYGGYFMSSDDELNRIWYTSAYTVQLDSVPTGSLPGGYRVANGALNAAGSNTTGGSDIGLYSPGTGWTNYTMTFQTAIVNQQAGWAVRTRDPQNGLVFILDTSGQLRALTAVANAYTPLASTKLPFAVTPGTWYSVSTTVNGSTVSVSINRTVAMTATSSAFSAGSIGFRQNGSEQALFRNLTVTTSQGGSLLNLPFSQASHLTGFRVPGSNEVPAILDGAKRDRLVWSGDIDTAGPAISYSVGNNDYLKGSLMLLATRQHTSGFVEGVVPSTFPVIPASGLTSETGAYSASYSMYFVLGLYDHLMFSGDRAFAASMWRAVQAQLAWNATRLDQRGLFITRAGLDGADWDFYDPDKGGAITEYNILYYRALMAAATIGDAIGQSTAAATYRAQAGSLRTAINTYMYDSARGVFRVSDTVSAIAQDANVLAILAGIPPQAEVPRILSAIKTALWTNPYGPLPFDNSFWRPIVSTFISGYEIQARYAGNDDNNAEQLMRTVFGRLANSRNNQYTGTMWENVGADGTPGLTNQTSLSHGWATGALSALSGYVLGIRPVTPGYDSWRVQPHPGSLSWAVGRAPTPHGTLTVKWAGLAGTGQFSMEVTVPAGTTGTVAVPTYGAKNPTLTVNGIAVWKNGSFAGGQGIASVAVDGQYIDLNGVVPGTYAIATAPGN